MNPVEPHRFEFKKPRLPERPATKWLVVGGSGAVVVLAIIAYLLYGTTLSLAPVYAGTARVPTGLRPSSNTASIAKAANAYQFTIAYPDKSTKSYRMADAGITVTAPASLAAINHKLQWAGPRRFMWWRPMHYTLELSTNQQKLQTFITTAASAANKPAGDAALDLTDGHPTVTPDTTGSSYTIPGGANYLQGRISRLNAATLTLTEQKITAAITAQDVASAQQSASAFTSRKITFTINGQTASPSANDIANWLDVSPVPDKHTVDVTLNSGKVSAYITALSKHYISPPVSQVNITNADGSTTVLIPGQNGVAIPNQNGIAASLTQQLQSGSGPITIDLPVSWQNYSTITASDYPKMLVVDLTNKRMYAYEHSTLVRTFLVSAGAPATPTVVGTYQIYAKYASQNMTGRNADGSRYNQPNVQYVNYFYQDYAVHGNYWRPLSYFGNINSSHGCVGIVNSDAAWVYDWAPIGTTVITHY